MYHQLRTSNRKIDLGTPTTGQETLSTWYWRELSAVDYGVIVEHLHYRMLVKRMLAGREHIQAAVVRDQFYKEPALPLPASEGVVARAIQLGVQEGALGLADLEGGEVNAETLKFDEPLPFDLIDFGPEQVLVSQEKSAALRAAQAAAQAEIEGGEAPPPEEEDTGVTVIGGEVPIQRRGAPNRGGPRQPRRRAGNPLSPPAPRHRRHPRQQNRRRQSRHLPAAQQPRRWRPHLHPHA